MINAGGYRPGWHVYNFEFRKHIVKLAFGIRHRATLDKQERGGTSIIPRQRHLMKVCPLIFAALCITPAFAAEFEIVRGSESPDQSVALAVRISDADKNHPEIVFFDVQQRSPIGANLSEKHIFRLIALAQKDSVHCPHYEVAWSSNGRRVAVYAGSHQFTGVDAYELRDGGPIALRLPDLTPQWREIDGWITPFRRTKRWKTSPAWNDQNQLLFSLGGSAYKNDGARESDFLSFAFRVTVRFDEAGEGRVEDTSKEA